MKVTFLIPAALREFTGARGTVQVESVGGTVADALAALWRVFPGVRDRVINEQEQVRQHINIFVGNENIRYTGGLTTPLTDGSFITIVPAVSGGAPQSECMIVIPPDGQTI
jgi:sulfur-carrier protein